MDAKATGHAARYSRWVQAFRGLGDSGMERAVGGEFTAFGVIQAEMLKHYGLKPDDYLIDVGCGSGRLAVPISRYLRGRYLGTDVVPELAEYARAITKRPDWRFEVVENIGIPEVSEAADMVCFFSILTHLLHEEAYIYLEEAYRVLRPGGRVIVSFLEFAMAFHWGIFEDTVADAKAFGDHPLNVFIERIALTRWADRLGFRMVEIRDGDDPFVPLNDCLKLEDGRVMEKFGNLGQSICVLEKPGD